MSKSTNIDVETKKSSQIREPMIPALDAESIFTFAKDIKKVALTEAQKKEVSATLSTSSSIATLGNLIDHFKSLKESYEAFSGLAENEKISLNQLMNTRKKLKNAIEKHEFTTKEYASFIANERKIVPLNKKIEYWSLNADSLKKLELWENITISTQMESEKNNETLEMQKNRLHQLSDIKNDWSSHQMFCKYSSDNLLEFYNSYISELEKSIKNTLAAEKKCPDIIIEYFAYLLYQLHELKKQAIHSMLYRLYCAEYYNDLECDDLLLFTVTLINNQCNINMTGPGLKPSPRNSLTPELLIEFMKSIEKYCSENPNERSIQANLSALRMKNTPGQWKILLNGKQKIQMLARNPIIILFANTIQTLLTQINIASEKSLDILNNSDHEIFNTLIKIKKLLNAANNQYIKIYGKRPSKSDNAIADMLLESEMKFSTSISDLNNKLDYSLQNQVTLMIDITFSDKEINSIAIKKMLDQIKCFKVFNNTYIKQDYLYGGDIILAIANKIKNIMSKENNITPQHLTNILRLLLAFYPQTPEVYQIELQKRLNSLNELLSKLKKGNAPDLLHYLVNYLETPLLSQEKLSTSLARHKQIANTYSENWDNTLLPNENNSIDVMLAYAKNVSLKLIKTSPLITLDNFDNHDLRLLLDNLDFVITDELKNTKNTNAASHHKNLKTLKASFEKITLEKINDLFLLKTYLIDNTSKKTNLLKLKDLLTRIDESFSEKENKNILLESIKSACFYLLKSYILHAVENEIKPDINHINQLNNIIHENIFEKLCKDNELRTVLKAYIDSYDGTKNNMTTLLIGLTPGKNHCDCEPALLKYASKRLDYLKSSMNINADDYQFFYYYANVASISALHYQYKMNMSNQIKSLVTSATWDSKTAKSIELFGDDNAVLKYRFLRIKELLNINHQYQLDADKSETLFATFQETINPNRVFNNKLIKTDSSLETSLTLSTYLNDIIAKQSWSLLLEKIITTCGTLQQAQQLHTQYLLTQLSYTSNFTESWIGKQITRTDQALTKQYYLDFLGATNIIKLIATLDSSLKEINRAINESETMTTIDHDKICKLITSIQPLQYFYSIFGDPSKSKMIFADLRNIKNKIQLTHELNTNISKQLDMLLTVHDNATLQTIIFKLTDAIDNIEHSNILTESSINYYLNFCSDTILNKIEQLIKINNTLDFKSLSALTNLLFYLSSGQTKSLLLTAYKEQLSTNPYWLSLINHLDEEHVVKQIEATTANDISNKYSVDFIKTLAFAKKLCQVKHQLNQKMKFVILHESDIKPTHPTQVVLRELLASSHLTDNQLLKLWSSYTIKLTTNYLYPGMKTSYLAYLIKNICKISDAILLRSKENPALLANLTDKFKTIYDIYHSIQKLFTPTTNNASLSLWSDNAESDKLLQPVFSFIQKTYIMQLLQRTEKYALEKIPKDKLLVFKKISNDEIFSIANTNSQLDLPAITQSLGIKNDENAVKVINTIKIYHHLSDILSNQKPCASLPAILTTLLNDAPKKNHFSLSSGYSSFLKELISLSAKCISITNDKKFPAESTPKTTILSLLKLH